MAGARCPAAPVAPKCAGIAKLGSMFKNTIKIPVEWGHCDPARIVFYPNYFFWFDQATRHLFDRAGFSYEVMLDEYKTVGLPLVDAHAEFLAPTRFGDEIEVTSHVSEWRRKMTPQKTAARIPTAQKSSPPSVPCTTPTMSVNYSRGKSHPNSRPGSTSWPHMLRKYNLAAD